MKSEKNKYLKRILSIVLVVMLLAGISACGKTIGTGGDKQEAEITQDTTKAAENTTTKQEETTKNTETTNAAEVPTDQPQTDDPVQQTEPPTEAPTEPPTEAPTEPPAPTWTISVTVDGKDHGGIFASGTYTYYYQPTAFDALLSTGLSYSGSSNYVSNINGLGEFDYGSLSGWLYAVNGEDPGVGCGSYYLNDGDSVYWHYTDDFTQE